MAVGFAGAAEPVGRSRSQMSIRITMEICIAEVDKTFCGWNQCKHLWNFQIKTGSQWGKKNR